MEILKIQVYHSRAGVIDDRRLFSPPHRGVLSCPFDTDLGLDHDPPMCIKAVLLFICTVHDILLALLALSFGRSVFGTLGASGSEGTL